MDIYHPTPPPPLLFTPGVGCFLTSPGVGPSKLHSLVVHCVLSAWAPEACQKTAVQK